MEVVVDRPSAAPDNGFVSVSVEGRPEDPQEAWKEGIRVRIDRDPVTLTAHVTANAPGSEPELLDVLVDHFAHAWSKGHGDAPDSRALADLSEADRARYAAFNAVRPVTRPARRIEVAVAARASLDPARTALVDGSQERSYGALVEEAAAFEKMLRARGVGAGDRVVLVFSRSIPCVALMLAVLQIGAVYVPCDPAWPAARIRAAIDQVAPAYTVRDGDTGVEITEPEGGRPPHPVSGELSPDDAACIIFTSGSTGTPKGVVLNHRAFSRLPDYETHELFSSSTVCLGAGPVQWDVWPWELWSTLIPGGTVVIHSDPHPTPETVRAAVRRGVNTAFITSALLNVIADEDLESLDGLRVLMSGGERLSPRHIERITDRFPELRLINAYGTVEIGVFATFAACDAPAGPRGLAIGTPPAETGVYVVERTEAGPRVCPVETPGEIAITGPGLGIEYLDAPAETAASFAELEVPDGPPVRAYLTGDRGVLGWDGLLYHRGRRDRQLKVRGVRAEPDAIEDILVGHPDVVRAAVLPMVDPEGLVSGLSAYVVPADSSRELNVPALREWIADRLPVQLVPRQIEPIVELPRTATGKVAVAELAQHPVESEVDALSLDGLKTMMAAILGLATISDEDSFFDLGGDSLLATRLAARVAAATERRVSVADVIDAPSPRQFLAVVAGAPRREGSTQPVQPSEGERVPVSSGQARHLIAFLEDRRSTGAIVQCVHTIEGVLDRPALERAWRAVVTAHEGLRTVIDIKQMPPLQVVLSPEDFALRCELADGPWLDLAAQARQIAADELRPFDITREAAVRARLVQDGARAVLVITQHHITTDGWSEEVMLRQLTSAYARATNGALDSDLVPETMGYRAYARWHASAVAEYGDTLGEYWSQTLEGLPSLPPLTLSTQDGPPEALNWRLSADATSDVRQRADHHGVPVLSVLIDRYAAALADVAGADDFAVGLTLSGRSHGAFDDTIGFFLNSVPVRVNPVGANGERLAEHHQAAMGAIQHSLLPFDGIVDAVAPERSARPPLAQAMLVMQPGPPPVLELAGCTVERESVPSAEDPFELTLEAWLEGETLVGGLHCPAKGTTLLADVCDSLFEGAAVTDGSRA